jgi:AcrR family transcriptional regulator
MKKVGLKKGGFYRHFKSKDDLFVEAVARALDETGRGMEEVAKSAPEGQALPSHHRTLSKRRPREFAGIRLRARRPRAGARTKAVVRAQTD